MAKRGLNASVLFNGYDLSRYFKSAAPGTDIELLDATTFQPTGGDKEFMSGFEDGKLSLEGFFQSDSVDADAVDDVINSVIGSTTRQVITVSPENADTLGNRCFAIDADTVSYKVTSPVGGLVMSTAEIQSSSGLGYGFILQILTALTATGNGTGLDNAASSANGGAGHLHVTARSGTSPTLDVKIQHSTDNSVWVDLITFAQKTAIGAERVEVTGTVNRYLRAIRTIGGTSPSFTAAVAFARY